MAMPQFGTQTNPEIKKSQPTLNIQKLNAYKKYSTSLHPPMTASVDTRDIGKLLYSVTLDGHTTVWNPDQFGN